MGFGDLANKAKDALNSDRGEKISDQGLDKVAAAADKLTGGKYTEQIQKGRDAADEKIGNRGAEGGEPGAGRDDRR
ncbi:antitoxin [Brevibacterium album]|uniref:antitoxin n=1 Tax=Brevibacterium album TaxID=417948 RepID=UPI000421A0EE|nr:antitoxin [Brevibacterium album]